MKQKLERAEAETREEVEADAEAETRRSANEVAERERERNEQWKPAARARIWKARGDGRGELSPRARQHLVPLAQRARATCVHDCIRSARMTTPATYNVIINFITSVLCFQFHLYVYNVHLPTQNYSFFKIYFLITN